MELLINLLQGIIAGIIWNITGYLKHTDKTYQPHKLLTAIVIGALVGLISAYLQIEFAMAYEILVDIGVIALLHHLLKLLYRNAIVGTWLDEMLSAFCEMLQGSTQTSTRFINMFFPKLNRGEQVQ